jgi:hypothetical protein
MASSERALATPSWRAVSRAVAARAMWYALDAPCAWSLGAEDARAARWDEDEATTSRMVDEDDLDDDGALLRAARGARDDVDARSRVVRRALGGRAGLVGAVRRASLGGAGRPRPRGVRERVCFRARWRRSARIARCFARFVGARASG